MSPVEGELWDLPLAALRREFPLRIKVSGYPCDVVNMAVVDEGPTPEAKVLACRVRHRERGLSCPDLFEGRWAVGQIAMVSFMLVDTMHTTMCIRTCETWDLRKERPRCRPTVQPTPGSADIADTLSTIAPVISGAVK